MINRSQLKFHETFQPETGYIAKILELASQSYSGDKFEISECTGIPTGKQKGKVEPHIKYATYMGLINHSVDKGKYALSLTELGSEVYSQDPYLHESLTQWLCHYNISKTVVGAPQWSLLVNDAHPGYIQPLSNESLMSLAEKKFDFQVIFEEAFGVVKRSYLDGFFSSINFVGEDSGGLLFTEMMERDEYLYVYAYALFDNWERLLSTKREITSTELIEELSFGKIFGFNVETVSDVLDLLADENLLIINRQLFPITIIKNSTAQSCVSLLYSRLL